MEKLIDNRKIIDIKFISNLIFHQNISYVTTKIEGVISIPHLIFIKHNGCMTESTIGAKYW